jgi:hypothetical protein
MTPPATEVARPAHPERFCQLCGGQNVTWFAPNELWNQVMGNPNGIVCPTCFILKAQSAGVVNVWRIQPEFYGDQALADAEWVEHNKAKWVFNPANDKLDLGRLEPSASQPAPLSEPQPSLAPESVLSHSVLKRENVMQGRPMMEGFAAKRFYDRNSTEYRFTADDANEMLKNIFRFAEDFAAFSAPAGHPVVEAQWVSVSERLPERDQWVQTYCERGHVAARQWNDWVPSWPHCGAKITHWKPLDAPPVAAAKGEK